MPPSLNRITSATSRALEFFTERELTMQMGFERRAWPIALLKELIDNSLDACESAGVAPHITVEEGHATLTVQDNGPGLPVQTLERSLDYMIRVSDKAYYVSPSRGQLGNALKCVWAAPYVLSPEHTGRVDVTTQGTRYQIDVRLDPLAQISHLTMTAHSPAMIKTGTAITIHWPSSLWTAWGLNFYHPWDLLKGYALFNPHVSLTYQDGDTSYDWPASNPTWVKWVPSRPTSPHWYSPARFEQLLAAYLVEDRHTRQVRTVREFLAEFDGLSGVNARKDVLQEAGLQRATLDDLLVNGTLDPLRVSVLLKAMQARAKAVKPVVLGVLGEPHVREALTAWYGVDDTTLRYRCEKGLADGLPYVLEVACGWRVTETASAGEEADEEGTDSDEPGVRLCGYNCAPSLRTPFSQLEQLCDAAEIDYDDPVVLMVHLTCPRLDATDRGKAAVVLPGAITDILAKTVPLVTKPWTALKKAIRREGRRQAIEAEQARRHQRPMRVKEAAGR